MTLQEKVWKIIRGLGGTWTYEEVLVLCEGVNKVSFLHYLKLLRDAGYVREEGKRKGETRGRRQKLWRLIKNTGPLPPAQCRCLFDRNTGTLAGVDCPGDCSKKKKVRIRRAPEASNNVD